MVDAVDANLLFPKKYEDYLKISFLTLFKKNFCTRRIYFLKILISRTMNLIYIEITALKLLVPYELHSEVSPCFVHFLYHAFTSLIFFLSLVSVFKCIFTLLLDCFYQEL